MKIDEHSEKKKKKKPQESFEPDRKVEHPCGVGPESKSWS
jgi:hypothetical protein